MSIRKPVIPFRFLKRTHRRLFFVCGFFFIFAYQIKSIMFQLKDNSGNLFVNQKKQTEKHPDFQGTLKIGEQDYYVSAWKKSGQKGEYLSLAVKVKEPKEMPF